MSQQVTSSYRTKHGDQALNSNQHAETDLGSCGWLAKVGGTKYFTDAIASCDCEICCQPMPRACKPKIQAHGTQSRMYRIGAVQLVVRISDARLQFDVALF